MNIADLYTIYLSSPRVVTDTRKIIPDSLFFALKGENFNGNEFALQALEKGAKYAIVDEPIEEQNDRLILVDNVLLALQKLANYHRNQFRIPLIGITGTNGKTTTKELLNAVLSQKFNVLATEGNFNNHIGVPLTLLQLTEKHEIAIIEMGANHKGEIFDLCEIAEPTIGLVTNVGLAHLEGFGTFENIVETKTDLYRFVEKNKGVNFLLKENELIVEKLKDFKFTAYSISDTNTTYYGKSSGSKTCLRFVLERVRNQQINPFVIDTNLVGDYNQSNVLSTIAIGDYFNVNLQKIKNALEAYVPTNNRSQITKTSRNSLILDAYNANPTSVMGALENFAGMSEERRVVILGDMFELGSFSEEKHQQVVDYLSEQSFNQIFIIGKAYYQTQCSLESIKKYETLDAFIQSGQIVTIDDSLVLLKASRGMGLESLIKYL